MQPKSFFLKMKKLSFSGTVTKRIWAMKFELVQSTVKAYLKVLYNVESETGLVAISRYIHGHLIPCSLI